MRLVAYTYEADIHCPNCAYDRFGDSLYNVTPPFPTDREGNDIHAVYAGDEILLDHSTCGDCFDKL